MKFSIIAAADKNMGIGVDNKLPWRLKGDLQYFQYVTTEAEQGKVNAVIMGRKTWESLPDKTKPLKDRVNVVLSRNYADVPDGVLVVNSLEDALYQLWNDEKVDKIFVIGGASVYKQAIEHPDCDRIYLTEVQDVFNCDAFFPEIDYNIFEVIEDADPHDENGLKYRFAVFGRKHK